jgi:hypothetical protein
MPLKTLILVPMAFTFQGEWNRGYKDGYKDGYSQGFSQGYGQAHSDGRRRMAADHAAKMAVGKAKAIPRIIVLGPNGIAIDNQPKLVERVVTAVVVYGPEGQDGPLWLLLEGEKRRVLVVPDSYRQPVARLLAADHVRIHGGLEQWKELEEPIIKEALLKLNWKTGLAHERFPVIGTAYVFGISLVEP